MSDQDLEVLVSEGVVFLLLLVPLRVVPHLNEHCFVVLVSDRVYPVQKLLAAPQARTSRPLVDHPHRHHVLIDIAGLGGPPLNDTQRDDLELKEDVAAELFRNIVRLQNQRQHRHDPVLNRRVFVFLARLLGLEFLRLFFSCVKHVLKLRLLLFHQNLLLLQLLGSHDQVVAFQRFDLLLFRSQLFLLLFHLQRDVFALLEKLCLHSLHLFPHLL
mmetsp:Transcript_16061/g.38664  ORF Transcript_16061/g.38664 Transcript_16061/m.38664 type:complete len:215 (-) Transcript_16061:1987-2631(-)